jgi:hypothetical protein
MFIVLRDPYRNHSLASRGIPAPPRPSVTPKTQKPPSDHPVGRGSISHFGYIKMISPAAIGVNKIVPIWAAPLPTKVDPTKVDIQNEL